MAMAAASYDANHLRLRGKQPTCLAFSMCPCSARELGDSGRMMPAIRIMKPGTAARSMKAITS